MDTFGYLIPCHVSRYAYQGGDEEGAFTDSSSCLKRPVPEERHRDAENCYKKCKVSQQRIPIKFLCTDSKPFHDLYPTLDGLIKRSALRDKVAVRIPDSCSTDAG